MGRPSFCMAFRILSMPEIEEGIDCACAKGQQRICSLNLEEIFLFLIVTKREPYCTSRMGPMLHLRQVN